MAEMKFKIGDKVRIVKNIWNTPHHSGDVGIGEIHKIVGVYPYMKYPYDLDGMFGYTWHEDELEFANNDKIVITHDQKTTTATLYREDGTKEAATSNCAPEDKFDFTVGAKLALERLTEKINEVVVKGFKVGDRVNVDGLNGTIICITMGDMFGVQFDDDKYDGHKCIGIKLKAGKPGDKSNCWWVDPLNVKRGEAKIKPKTNPVKYWTGRAVCTKVESWAENAGFKVGHIYKVVDGKFIDDGGTRRPIIKDRVTSPKDFETEGNYFNTWAYKFTPIVE